MKAGSAATHRSPQPRRTTLLALVQALTSEGYSEQAVETEVLGLLDSGQVLLTGSFRATSLRSGRPDARGDQWEG
jgi:hypothetical protein